MKISVLEITMQHIESTSRVNQLVLRAKVSIMPLYVLSRLNGVAFVYVY